MEAEGLLDDLEAFMVRMEEELAYRTPDGYTPGLRFITHLWEPLRHMYRCECV
jgi:hypothetical protein